MLQRFDGQIWVSSTNRDLMLEVEGRMRVLIPSLSIYVRILLINDVLHLFDIKTFELKRIEYCHGLLQKAEVVNSFEGLLARLAPVLQVSNRFSNTLSFRFNDTELTIEVSEVNARDIESFLSFQNIKLVGARNLRSLWKYI